jgi:hypothetical protein
VAKKRFRKKSMYTQDNMDLRLLEPFNDGTIVGGVMGEELIFVNFITGQDLGIHMPFSYVHESASRVHKNVQGNEVPHELGTSFNTMARTLAIMESNVRRTETYVHALQHVHAVPPRVLNPEEKHG